MENVSKYLINKNATILEALKALNDLSSRTMTLFVQDENNKLIGTITDGDIRRSLISGTSLTDSIESVMYRGFSYCISGEKNIVTKIKRYKKNGIYLIPIVNDSFEIIRIINLHKTSTILPLDAVLMAGGKGERLLPLTKETPKPLLKIGNKSIIDYNVERIITFGINNIFITVNYLKEQIENHFMNQFDGVKIICVREPSFLGTFGSLKLITNFENDLVLVMNSDLLTNIDFEDLFLDFIESGADMSVAVVPYSISIPYGIFDHSGKDILGVREKPIFDYFANAGIYLIKRNLLAEIPNGKPYNATDFIYQLIEKGKKVIKFPLNGYWLDIGTHTEFQKANELIKQIQEHDYI